MLERDVRSAPLAENDKRSGPDDQPGEGQNRRHYPWIRRVSLMHGCKRIRRIGSVPRLQSMETFVLVKPLNVAGPVWCYLIFRFDAGLAS